MDFVNTRRTPAAQRDADWVEWQLWTAPSVGPTKGIDIDNLESCPLCTLPYLQNPHCGFKQGNPINNPDCQHDPEGTAHPTSEQGLLLLVLYIIINIIGSLEIEIEYFSYPLSNGV